jgi:hypothetical protein
MAATGTGSDEGTRPRGGGAARARFDVVALVASAGGLSALNQVLLHLPDDFGGPVVIVQHLGGANSTLVDILRRRSPCRWSGSPTTRPSSQAGSSSARPSACWRSCPTATARRARSSPPHAAPDRLVPGLGRRELRARGHGRGPDRHDSPSWRAFTGQRLDEWLGLGWMNAVHPEDRAHAGQQWREAVERRTPISTRLRLWHAPTRSWRDTQVRAMPLYTDDGSVRGWMGMSIDLTPEGA